MKHTVQNISMRFVAVAIAAALTTAGCDDNVVAPKPEPAGADAQPGSVERHGIGTTPSFSGWISEPTILNEPVEEIVSDVDGCPDCSPVLRQENSVTGKDSRTE